MAEINRNIASLCDDSIICPNVQTIWNCANCALKDQLLQSTLIELKSAQAIISILREDIKHADHSAASCQQTMVHDIESLGDDQDNQNWKTILCKNTSNKQSCVPEVRKKQYPYLTVNRFAPLSNLNDGYDTEEDIICKDKHSRISHPYKKPLTQQCTGPTIPTIVNGTVTHKPGIKIAKKVCNTQSNSIVRLTEHKVKIIGNSHLKGSATRINQYLNTKYKLTSFIKPGANINHLVHSQDNELKCLGKKDIIVINGGTNDMDNYNCKVNGILKILYSFIVKYSNTNIIIVNLPQRYDQQITSKSNLFIQAFNHKLNKIAKMFNHVSVVEMYSDRRLYTRHGLHMNYQGKEMFAKKSGLPNREVYGTY
jgi:hypothetical protein